MKTVEDAVRETLVAREVRDYDATDLLNRVRDEIESPDLVGAQSARLTRLVIVAAAAAVLALMGTGWWISLRDEPRSPVPSAAAQSKTGAPSTTNRMPPAQAGAKFVGYRGVMLAVPRSWIVPSSSCASQPARIIDIPGRGRSPQPCTPSALDAGVSFDNSIVGPPDLGEAVSGGDIGGDQVLLTDVQRRGSYFEQILAVPARHFYVRVFARHRRVMNPILESAQAVPAGYTAVPQVVGSWESSAALRLAAAGLEMRPPQQPRALGPGPLRVEKQFPAAGSVVKVGTTFRLSPGR